MKTLITAASLLILAGCASSGTQVSESQLAKFEAGKTTVSEVTAALGAPNQNMLMGDGSRMLIYSYAQYQTRPETFIPLAGAFVGGGDMKTNTAILRFDRAGLLVTSSASSGAYGSGMGFASGTGMPKQE